jgi:hypothetical protein
MRDRRGSAPIKRTLIQGRPLHRRMAALRPEAVVLAESAFAAFNRHHAVSIARANGYFTDSGDMQTVQRCCRVQREKAKPTASVTDMQFAAAISASSLTAGLFARPA